jgi:hypothetical protein
VAARTSSSGTKCRPEDDTSSPTAGEADGADKTEGEANGGGSNGPATGDATPRGAKNGSAAGEEDEEQEEEEVEDWGEEERTTADARTAALSRRGPAIRAAMLNVLRVPVS